MPKAYLVVQYRAVKDPEKLAAYAALAPAAIAAAGGRFIVRTAAVAAYEQGKLERTVVIEFNDLASAMRLYDSPLYREALIALGDGAERDMRVVEGYA